VNENNIETTCASADELAAAYALGALAAAEEKAVSAHLASCAHPHAEARALIDAASLLPTSLEPVAAPAHLRERLMATVTATPQDHRMQSRSDVAAAKTRHRWWQMPALPAAVSAIAVAAAVGLGVWGVTLDRELAGREAALHAVATSEAVHRVSGSAGSGWVVERSGSAIFLAENLAVLPADRLYELWLIDEDGLPTAVGTFTETAGVVVVPLERGLGDATTFAVTLESERVDEPTTDPVLVGVLDG
jgi:anti-sigma-K factor RskA